MSGDATATLAAPAATARRGEGPRQREGARGTADAMWFVLRNGALPWVILVVVAVCVAVFSMRGAPWRADLLWIVDWIPISHLAVAPVVAGAAAVDMARLSVGTRHVEGARWWRSPGTAVTLAYAAGIGGAYVAVVVGAALVELPPAFDPLVLLALGVQVLMLTFFAAAGVLVGRVLGTVLGGIVAAVVALAGIYLFSAQADHIAVFYAGASLVPRVGRSYDVVYLAVQAGLLSCLILACLLARPGVMRSGRRRAAERTVGVLAVGLLVVAASVGPSSRLTYTGEPPTLCSDVSGVRVCLYPEHARVQGDVNAELARMVDAARAGGYDSLVPAEVREGTGNGEEDWPGPLLLIDEPLAGARIDPVGIAMNVIDPFWCEGRVGEEPLSDAFWADHANVVGTWLELVDPDLPGREGWEYARLTPGEVDRLMTEFRTCTYPFR